MKLKLAALAAAGAITACAPPALETNTNQAAPSAAYKYQLTAKTAYECGVLHAYAQKLKAATNPEWATNHKAMNAAWMGVAIERNIGEFKTGVIDRWADELDDRIGRQGSTVELEPVLKALEPCEVMSTLYRGDYDEAVRRGEATRPELFPEGAAFKLQTGGEVPDAPEKELTFDDWFFFARGNLCFAAPTDTQNGKLTLGFINFFDGSLTLEGDNLPELTEDNYETEMPKHQAGISWSREEDVFLPVLDEGVTYDSFQGTAIFIDQKPVAMLNGEYLSMGTKYVFGAHIQRPYFNLMPIGRELTVKVLGKETHRFPIKPALWNEIAECMAQYPFG